jgi:hypothetical protein
MNNDPSNKRLIDEENYKTTFSLNDLEASLLIYSKLISGFIKDMAEDINVSELSKFMFILEKGVETITNVYKTILLYTRNLELAEYHTERACIYYIEFTSQIIGSEINVRESVLFVYKKTIFEINNECKKRVLISAEQNVYFTILDEYALFFHTFIKSVLSERNVDENKCIMAGILNEKSIDYSRKLVFSNDLTHIRLAKLKFLNSLISGLSILKCSHIRIFNILDAVLKKMMKLDTSDDGIIRFSMEKLTNAFENNYSPLKTAYQLLLM